MVQLYVLLGLAAAVSCQSDSTASITTTSPLVPPSGSDCYGAQEDNVCLTESYILSSCNAYHPSIDDNWKCLCTDNFASAWSACLSCKAKYNTTSEILDSTEPYIGSCPSILSVLSVAAASSSSAAAAASTVNTDTTSTGATASPSPSPSTPAATATGTGASGNSAPANHEISSSVLMGCFLALLLS